jgi:predicted GNAT family acetyltransferase
VQEIAVGNLFVAEATQGPPKILAMASCEAWTQEAVQIGAQYTPAPWRDRAYTSVAVLGAAVHARNHGIKRAVLLSGKHDVKGQAATRTLGFVAVDEFGALHAPA